MRTWVDLAAAQGPPGDVLGGGTDAGPPRAGVPGAVAAEESGDVPGAGGSARSKAEPPPVSSDAGWVGASYLAHGQAEPPAGSDPGWVDASYLAHGQVEPPWARHFNGGGLGAAPGATSAADRGLRAGPGPWIRAGERLRRAVRARLPALAEARVVPSAAAVVALGLVILVTILGTTAVVLRNRPHGTALPVRVTAPRGGAPASPASSTGTAGSAAALTGPGSLPAAARAGSPGPAAASAAASAAAVLVVDVVGPVRRPGVVRLPAGARVADAVAAAGGLRRGSSPGLLNLAAVLTDGQQVVVGSAGAGAGAGAGAVAAGAGSTVAGSPTAGGAAGPVLDLNTATAGQLDALPGIGPVLAERIVQWRTANGRFTSVDQLTEVGGIGARRLADLRPRVRV